VVNWSTSIVSSMSAQRLAVKRRAAVRGRPSASTVLASWPSTELCPIEATLIQEFLVVKNDVHAALDPGNPIGASWDEKCECGVIVLSAAMFRRGIHNILAGPKWARDIIASRELNDCPGDRKSGPSFDFFIVGVSKCQGKTANGTLVTEDRFDTLHRRIQPRGPDTLACPDRSLHNFTHQGKQVAHLEVNFRSDMKTDWHAVVSLANALP
jgi:hypothetical protein